MPNSSKLSAALATDFDANESPATFSMSLSNRTVVKLGGSLMNCPDLVSRLSRFLDSRSILVVGGGIRADSVRALESATPIKPASSHWLAIEAMSINAAVLAELCPQIQLVRSCEQLIHSQTATVVDATAVLTEVENASIEDSRRLPRSWNVTSDSIAAYLAVVFGVPRLTLLKSVDLPSELNSPLKAELSHSTRLALTQRLAAEQYVDPSFVRYSAAIAEVSWCNLRTETPRLNRLW